MVRKLFPNEAVFPIFKPFETILGTSFRTWRLFLYNSTYYWWNRWKGKFKDNTYPENWQKRDESCWIGKSCSLLLTVTSIDPFRPVTTFRLDARWKKLFLHFLWTTVSPYFIDGVFLGSTCLQRLNLLLIYYLGDFQIT